MRAFPHVLAPVHASVHPCRSRSSWRPSWRRTDALPCGSLGVWVRTGPWPQGATEAHWWGGAPRRPHTSRGCTGGVSEAVSPRARRGRAPRSSVAPAARVPFAGGCLRVRVHVWAACEWRRAVGTTAGQRAAARGLLVRGFCRRRRRRELFPWPHALIHGVSLWGHCVVVDECCCSCWVAVQCTRTGCARERSDSVTLQESAHPSSQQSHDSGKLHRRMAPCGHTGHHITSGPVSVGDLPRTPSIQRTPSVHQRTHARPRRATRQLPRYAHGVPLGPPGRPSP
jgi:hypothetical protein